MTTEVKTCFLAMYISFFYFFISFAFLLLICLFFLSSKNFKNMLKSIILCLPYVLHCFSSLGLFSKSYLGLAEFFKFMALYLLSVWENSLPQSCQILFCPILLFSPIHDTTFQYIRTFYHDPLLPPYLFHPFPAPVPGHFWLTHLPVH